MNVMMDKPDIKGMRKKIAEKLETISDPGSDDLFLAINSEVNEFNLFMKHAKITKEQGNVLGAISTAIRFALIRPGIMYDDALGVFNMKNVATASRVIDCLRCHMELFVQFDASKVQQKDWAINSINQKKVQIIVKLNPETSEEIMENILTASRVAREKGWNGFLEIVQASSKTVIFPT